MVWKLLVRQTCCSEIFFFGDWCASCQLLFFMTVNSLFTDGLKNDTFGSLQLSPPFHLTFIPIDIIKIWIISQTTSFNFNELKVKIPKAILCDFLFLSVQCHDLYFNFSFVVLSTLSIWKLPLNCSWKDCEHYAINICCTPLHIDDRAS